MTHDRELILNRLKAHWKYAKTHGVKEDSIIGIFAYGSMNYGFWDEKYSNVDSKIITIPSFEELCLESDWSSKELHFEDERIEVQDIRGLRTKILKQDINFIEILYTDYFVLNPIYAEIWKNYFINNREAISHYDRSRMMKSVTIQLINTLQQDASDSKNLYNAHRLYYFLENYLNNKIYLDCIHPEGKSYEFLRDLKLGLNRLSHDKEAKIENAEELKQKVKDLNSIYPQLTSPLRKKALIALNDGVIEIIKLSLQNLKQPSTTKEEFFKQLTNAEQKAYYSIIKETGSEGNISISKLVDQNAISRPVYNNLIIKMKKCRVASVVNQGMKGTNIKIIQPELRAEASNYN